MLRGETTDVYSETCDYTSYADKGSLLCSINDKRNCCLYFHSARLHKNA